MLFLTVFARNKVDTKDGGCNEVWKGLLRRVGSSVFTYQNLTTSGIDVVVP